MATQLSMADVARLMAEPSGEALATTMAKVAEAYGAGTLSQSERAIAEDIIRILAKDGELAVRQVLVGALKGAAVLPRDIAGIFLADSDDVAAPLVRESQALGDLDLLEVLNKRGPALKRAVAERAGLSPVLVEAVIETGDPSLLAGLLANPAVELSAAAVEVLLKQYGEDQAVVGALCGRAGLAPGAAEALYKSLSEQFESDVLHRKDATLDEICDGLFRLRQVAILNLMEELSVDDELERLAERLQCAGQLSPSLILRSLCLGDLKLFEAAMARLAGISVQSARTLIHDKGTLGLESIYLRAALPESVYPAIRAGVEVAKQTSYDGLDEPHARYTARMLERNLTAAEDPAERLGEGDLDYLLGKLEGLAA
ncbi:MAG: DUF2336 domain-containing protein [Pseudomonadota bacterium]